MADVMTFVLNARDNISRVMDHAGDASDRLAKRLLQLGAIGGAGPVGAGVAVGVGAMAAAFTSAGVAAGAFGLAVQPQIALMKESASAAQKVATAQETAARKKAVADELTAKGSDLAGKAQKAYTSARLAAVDAEKAYQRQTAGMPKETAEAALSLAKLKTAHEGWSASLAKDTMPLFTRGLDAARKSLPLLTPLVKTSAAAFTHFADSGDKSGGFKRFITRLDDAAKDTLPALLNSGRNVFRGLGGIIDAFLPSSDNFASGMERGTAAFARWGQGLKDSDGFKRFVDTASAGGGALSTLALSAGGLLSALSPLIGTTATIATGFAKIIGWLPPETLEFIAGALLGIKVATLGWAGAQALLNIAMAANPVGLVIMGLVLLGAALVTAWEKSQFFREIVTDAFTSLASPMLGFASIALQIQKTVWLSFLDFADNLLAAGDKAFGWVPGVGDKLKAARGAVDTFKGGVEAGMDIAIEKVDGWKTAVDRMPLEIRIKGDITDLEQKITKAKEQLSDKNLPPGKRAKLTADITNWNTKLVEARVKLETTPAKKQARLTADITDWTAKSAAAARALADKNLPPGKRAKLTADKSDLDAKVAAAKKILNSLNGKTALTYVKTEYSYYTKGPGPHKDGYIFGNATGGLIRGPGTSTSDSILRRLSDGEYVIPANRVSEFGVDFFDAIRSGNLDTAMPAPQARTVATRSAPGGAQPVLVQITVNGALDPVASAKQVQKLLLELKRIGGVNIDLGV